MRFSLQDVKKKVQRRGGTLSMTLGFLRPGEADEAIERLVDYHERLLGRPQRQFSADEARACIGDYRLADCLIATLSHWYSWRQRDWASVLLEMGADPERAGQMDCTSPVQLRLALYDYVNEQFQGFLDSQARAQALQGFADRYGLSAANLEYLLSLDSEGEALLVREAARPPEPVEVTTLYNQWAFEAALCNASSVYFVIDCRAFGLSSGIGLGIGAAIKRLVFLARKLGVYYDLAYEGTTASPAPPERLTLTLYGPQEVSGAPQQYGLRLARLCRLLLGYGSPKAANTHRRFVSAIVEAEATVHFLQRSYQFSLNGQLLRLFPTHIDDERVESSSAAPVFDSGIEQSFGEAFVSLAGRQGLDGWSLEREPEPLLLDQHIFIPDFAVTRGQRRIYVEILGFWTPAYRERKVQRLQQLRGRSDLLLAIPVEAKEAFAAVAGHFPVLYYDGQLSISDLLHVLRRNYDDFDERLAGLDIEAVRARVRREQHLPEQACYTALSCYRRSEIEQAAGLVIGAGIAYQPGLGLYTQDWLERIKQTFIAWLREHGSCSFTEALRGLTEVEADTALLETLLTLWPEVRVRRDSIFEAVVELAESAPAIEQPEVVVQPVKRQVRERRSTKKRAPQEVTQGDLWGA